MADGMPERFKCPITHDVMTDPVLAADGYVYERIAIAEWLQRSTHSPLTNQALPHEALTPCHQLRSDIMEFLERGSTATAESNQPIPSGVVVEAIPVASAPPEPVDEAAVVGEELQLDAYKVDDEVVIKLTPPASTRPKVPTNICIALDVSASMDEAAELGPTGSEGGQNLSVLDMCKHAAKTIIKMLDSTDTFALVTFSDDSKVALHPTQCDNGNKSRLVQSVQTIKTENKTNIWSGMEAALGTFVDKKGENNHLILLTDGVPNINPMRGEVYELKKKIRRGGLGCTVSTCGFGYTLDSEMLVELAAVGGGSYSFIPDCSVLGSVFINWTANAQTTMLCDVSLSVSAFTSSCQFQSSQLTSKVLKDTVTGMLDEATVKIDQIAYDTPREVVIPTTPDSLRDGMTLDLKITSTHWHNGTSTVTKSVPVRTAGVKEKVAVYRTQLVDACLTAAEQARRNGNRVGDGVVQRVQGIASGVQGAGLTGDEYGEALLKDLEGQIQEATSRDDWFEKWGRHYLPSLGLAHHSHRSNNFKDGVQVYGSDMFNDIVDAGGQIFQNMELMSSGIRRRSSQIGHMRDNMHATTGASRAHIQYSAPMPSAVSARAYYDPSGVCVAPDTPVLLADGSTANASALVKGASVRCSDGSTATVECVVRSPAPQSGLVAVNGVRMTPWHPVVDQGQWVPAIEAVGAVEDAVPGSEEVFNFVLSNAHNVVLVGKGGARVVAATLGHNMTDTPAVAHAFFGTCAVIHALAECDGWESGDVTLRGVQRDCRTTQIVGVVC